jgi:CheY-like chemotaxis protein
MRRVQLLVFDDDLVSHPDFLGAALASLANRHGGSLSLVASYRPHADAALSEVRALAPDLVLMDYHMGPHADGATAIRALRAHHPPERLPILAISSDAGMNRLMLLAGACEACVKMALPDALPVLLPSLLGPDLLRAGAR